MGGVDVSPSSRAINKVGDWRQKPGFNRHNQWTLIGVSGLPMTSGALLTPE